MSDLFLLTILLGILGFMVLILIWLVVKLERSVSDLKSIAKKIEEGK